MSLYLVICAALIAFGLGALPAANWSIKAVQVLAPKGGKKIQAFARTFADIMKGFLVVLLLTTVLDSEVAKISALGVFFGHIYPVLRRYSGGNGMGVLLGALTAFDPLIGLIALVSWTAGYYVFRLATQAAFSSAIATPLVAMIYDLDTHINVFVLFAISAFVFWRQREHLVNYLAGNEQVVYQRT